ncbi:MAG: phosphoglycerate dehydrogenase [Chloroflexota bacterium]
MVQPTNFAPASPEALPTDTFRVYVTTDLTEFSLRLLEEATDIDLVQTAPRTKFVRENLPDVHAIIARDDVDLSREIIGLASNLRVIGRVGAGLNGIDMDAATEHGIIVMNTPGTSAIAAAEHTLLLMLALSRRLPVVHNAMKEGWWLLDRTAQAGTQLYGKTLGIYGLGRVGSEVARRVAAFGMDVLAFDPYIADEQIQDLRVTMVSQKELLARSDYVSIHVPLTKDTNTLFDAELIAQMKPGARLINAAAGRIWDEGAVAKAVQSGQLSGVAVDTFVQEPPYNSPLVGMDNVVHTPHIGDNTVEATQDVSIQIVQQVLDALRGTDYRNAVNMPLLPGMNFEEIRPLLMLGERVGQLQHALARSPIRRVAVETNGDEMDGMVKPLTVAILKGILDPVLSQSVSYINAPVLAAERGLHVTQTKGLRTANYANMLSCQVFWEDGTEIIISGTLLDHREPHIVQIDRYPINFVPDGRLLIMGSYDKPGVIGKVATMLAENSINIASWYTGRAAPGGNTLTVLSLDDPLPVDLLAQLRDLDFVRHAVQVEL